MPTGVGEWIAVVGLVGTLLGTGGGLIWKISALVSEVKGIRSDVQEINGSNIGEHRRLWARHRMHDQQLAKHHDRLRTVEFRLEIAPQE